MKENLTPYMTTEKYSVVYDSEANQDNKYIVVDRNGERVFECNFATPATAIGFAEDYYKALV